MKNSLFYSLMTACIFSLLSCQQAPETPAPTATAAAPASPDMAAIKAEIQSLENAWAAALSANDLATIMTFYADDAVSLQNNKPMVTGKAAIQKENEAEAAKRKDVRVAVTFEVMDVFGNENLVTEVGKTTFKDASGKVTYTGKYMSLWEKRNGKWLVIREIFNDDAKEK